MGLGPEVDERSFSLRPLGGPVHEDSEDPAEAVPEAFGFGRSPGHSNFHAV